MRRRPEKENMEICGCVFRAVFRACLAYYKSSVENEADFELPCRNSLSATEQSVFKLYFLRGHGWKYCGVMLSMKESELFYHAHSISEKLGRVFVTEKIEMYKQVFSV